MKQSSYFNLFTLLAPATHYKQRIEMNEGGNRVKKGFTLIELLIVLSIIGILAVTGINSYLASLQRSKDARRKVDIGSIQKALESYYYDYNQYPASTASTDLCADAAHCYLKTIPVDPGGGIYYYLRGNISGTNQSFQLYSKLDRSDDTGIGSNQAGYSANCGGTCKYGVSSANTAP